MDLSKMLIEGSVHEHDTIIVDYIDNKFNIKRGE